MLTVTVFNPREKTIVDIKSNFKSMKKKEWFYDPLAQKWMKDIDLMDHVADFCLRDRWGDIVPPEYLSSGSKALFLMKFQDILPVFATRCGNNCIPYIEEISRQKRSAHSTSALDAFY